MSAVIQPSYKRTEIGEIPENWDVVRLGSVIQEGRHIRYGVVQPGKLTSNGCFMLRSQDYSKGWSDTDGMHRLSKQLEAQFKNAKLKTGDLVMTVVGAGIGQIEIIPDWLDGAILSRSTARIGIDNSKAEPAFVRYFLESPTAKRQILDCQKEGAQPVVSCPDLACFHITLPSIEEQIKIASALTEVDTLIRKLDQLVTKKRDIQQAAMQQLLSGQRRLPGFNAGWEVARLGEISFISKGEQLSQKRDVTGLIPHFNGGVSASSYTDTANTPKDTIAISEGGNSCGYVQFITSPFWCGGHCYAVRPRGVENIFLYFALKRKQDSIMGLRVGSGLPNIQKSALNTFEIELPSSRAEQTAIATILSDMDRELAALKSRREKSNQIKHGMMQQLLSGKLRII